MINCNSSENAKGSLERKLHINGHRLTAIVNLCPVTHQARIRSQMEFHKIAFRYGQKIEHKNQPEIFLKNERYEVVR